MPILSVGETGRHSNPAPPVGRTPWSAAGPRPASSCLERLAGADQERVRGTRADRGVRPTGGVGGAGEWGKKSGVTLIELLVVLAIIGVLAGISFPAVSAGIDSVRLRSATDSLSAFLNGALTRAERRQQPMEVVISTQDNSLRVYSTEPGYTRELKMPDGVTIEAVLPQELVENGPRRLLLMPGGTVPGIGVQVVNRHGSRRIVSLDPMTGFPHVESVQKK